MSFLPILAVIMRGHRTVIDPSENGQSILCPFSHTGPLGLRFESLPHPPYSPDLAPSDFYLFPNLKGWLQGERNSSNKEVKWEADGYFGGVDKS